MKQYYKQAAIFVFPSLYEGFGLPPLEALAAGCPRVICSNAASLPEVCADMVEYFQPSNEKELMEKIVSKSFNLMNENSSNSSIIIRKLSKYSWNKMTTEYINNI